MKKNIKWYILILLFAILLQNISSIKSNVSYFITKITQPTVVNVYSDDTYLVSRLSKGYSKNGYKIKYSPKQNADVIISRNTLNETNYKESNSYFYTPIVAYEYYPSNHLNLSYDDGYYFSYFNIIQGFMNDKKYKDIGLYSSDKIKIVIPDKTSEYYQDIEKAIKSIIRNDTSISYKKFYEKCNKEFFVNKLFDDQKSIVFAPEAYLAKVDFDPIYDNTFYYIKYNVYIRENIDANISTFLFFSKFANKLGLRSSENATLKLNHTKEIIEYKENPVEEVEDDNRISDKQSNTSEKLEDDEINVDIEAENENVSETQTLDEDELLGDSVIYFIILTIIFAVVLFDGFYIFFL